MNNILERFNKIKSNINDLNFDQTVNIIAVSKTFLDHIRPLIDRHTILVKIKFKRQTKWTEIKKEVKDLNLHM